MWQQDSCLGKSSIAVGEYAQPCVMVLVNPHPSLVCLPAPTQVTLGVLVHLLKLSLHTPYELEQEWGGVSESQKIVNHS